jgi:hypothetical protein
MATSDALRNSLTPAGKTQSWCTIRAHNHIREKGFQRQLVMEDILIAVAPQGSVLLNCKGRY